VSEHSSSLGFKPEYFDELARLETENFWFRARNRLIVWTLRKYFPGCRNFLEIGCGNGFVLAGIRNEFPHIKLVGAEPFVEGLHTARRRLRDVPLLRADARQLPFTDRFDAVGAFDVLEHIDEDERVLDEMFHVVHPGGGLIVTVPQHRALWSALDDFSCHRRRYGRSELIGKIEAAGFHVLRWTSFVFVLAPAMYLSRRGRPSRVDPRAELAIPFVVNWSFERLLDFERFFIKLGVSYPVGGSLLVVAQRP